MPTPAIPWPPTNDGIVLLGTDTAVGKSTIAAALLHLLSSRGLRPVPFKPVETGASPFPADASLLLAASHREDIPIQAVCPYSFAPPFAPAIAAAASGVTLSISTLLAAASTARAYGKPMIVETAGGLLSPYADHLTSADLAAALSYPVLLIARNALGTINHTTLAVAEIRRRGLPLLGVILVNTNPLATHDNLNNSAMIANLTGVVPLGILTHQDSPTPASLASALEAAVDLRPVLDRLI